MEYRSIGVLAPDGGWVREEGGQGGTVGRLHSCQDPWYWDQFKVTVPSNPEK